MNDTDPGEARPLEQARPAGRGHEAQPTADQAGVAQDMGSLLQEYEESQHSRIHRGDLVEGTVVLVDREELLVDIGGKMEAILPVHEMPSDNGASPLKRGDRVTGVVVSPENSEGRPIISINRARAEIGWRDLEGKFESGELLEGEVVDQNKGGLIVEVDAVRGFVPLSQIVELKRTGPDEPLDDKLRAMRGQRMVVKVIEMNRRRNRLILSERAASRDRRAEQKDRLLAELQAGEMRHGRVSSLTDFGAFVDLGGSDGLIHLSELSWGQVAHPSQVVKVGDEVDVRVVGVDRENKKIALSLKQVEENPWTRIEERCRVGDIVTARITKLAQFGAFAEVEAGVEGLVHISELSDERITHPKQVVREGEDVQVKIIRIDSVRHRLGLSLRQAGDPSAAYAPEEDWGGSSYATPGSGDITADVDEAGEDDLAVPDSQPEVPEETTHEPPAASDDQAVDDLESADGDSAKGAAATVDS